MRVPVNLTLQQIQEAFRDIHERLRQTVGSENSGAHPNVKGKRITNAGDAKDATDLVTYRQMQAAIDGATLPVTSDVAGAGDSASGDGGADGGTDDGFGAQGCSQAGATGHVSAGAPLSAVTAGQIVCGTGNEFPSLLAATVDQPTRDSNAVQLIGRMIWHLQQAGFTAGKQQNPSGVISNNKLTVLVEGSYRAYDVLVAANDFTQPMGTGMSQVFPATYVADGGIAD